MSIDLEKNHGAFIHEGVFNELQDKVDAITDKDIYPVSGTVTGGKLHLVQTDPSKNIDVDLPVSGNDDLIKQLAEQEHLHEFENQVSNVANSSTTHGQSYYRVNKFGGEFVVSLNSGDQAGIAPDYHELEMLYDVKNNHRSDTYDVNDEYVFVNTFEDEVYVTDEKTHNGQVKKVAGIGSLAQIQTNTKGNVYEKQNGSSVQVVTVLPIGTVLYQLGYNLTAGQPTTPTPANAFVFNQMAKDAGTITLKQTETELKEQLAGYEGTDGKYHIPLVYNPRLMQKNFLEEDVPDVILNQVGNVPSGYEVRMYELTTID